MTCAELRLHLALEVRFPGCYVMMAEDHNLMIRSSTKKDNKLIFSRAIYTEIESRTSYRREQLCFLIPSDWIFETLKTWEWKRCGTPCGILQWNLFLRTFMFYWNECCACTYGLGHCDQIRQYYYFLADDYQNFIFCCSRVLRQHFITCHSWLGWKAFENQFISKNHVFVVTQIIWNNNARHSQKSRWILQSALRITRLKHSWEFPGFAVNIILVGRFAGNASNHVENFTCLSPQ